MNLTNQKLNQAIKLIQDCIKLEDDVPTGRPLCKYKASEDGTVVVERLFSKPNPKRNLTIELNDNEQKSYDDFYEAHKGCQKYTGAIGVNNVRLIVTGTSMGWLLECECTECSEKKNISDMDSW